MKLNMVLLGEMGVWKMYNFKDSIRECMVSVNGSPKYVYYPVTILKNAFDYK